MKRLIKNALKNIPYLRQTIFLKWTMTGHFYSTVPSIDSIKKHEDLIFGHIPPQIPGLDLHEQEQLALLEELKPFYAAQPFTPQQNSQSRYFFENDAFTYADAIFLHCMLRLKRPKRIIEVGSGYSSCVTLDTNELHFNNSIQCTFIEPYPKLLRSLIRDSDHARIKVIDKRLESVPLEEFAQLASGDFLFIDSSHVAKVGSDVNHIFSKLLPALQSGVYIHFHDIFYPFEYPKEWIYNGIAWNEAYVLRSFLQYNTSFEIVLFPNYLIHFHRDFFSRHMPLCLENYGGSIWIRKE